MDDNLKIEKIKIIVDLSKWMIGGIVVIIGFFMIRPHEQERLDTALKLEIHKAYLSATDTENIELWQRKLYLLKAITDESDKKMYEFIEKEEKRLDIIKDEKVKFIAAKNKRTETENLLLEYKKKYDDQKIKYENLAKTNYQEKSRLEKEKNELEIKIEELKKEKIQAIKTETESKKKLEESGLSKTVIERFIIRTEDVVAGSEG